MVRFGKKHGQIWQKVVLVSTMFSKTMMAKLQRSANTVDTLVLEGGRHLKRLIVVFQVHFWGAKNICV